MTTPSPSLNALRQEAPAIFDGRASTKLKPSYRFINAAEVLNALRDERIASPPLEDSP